MNATARHARATRRQLAADTRAARRAQRAVTAGPASAKHHLIAAGLPVATATRFAAAFSRGVHADATGTAVIKLRGRRTKRVDVKLYAPETAVRRLAAYRPKDKAAAAVFERAAA